MKWNIDTDGVYMPIDTLTHTFGSDVVEMTLLALPFMGAGRSDSRPNASEESSAGDDRSA